MKDNPTLQTPKIVVALCDYQGQGEDELNFLEGDRLQVLDSSQSLWRVIHLTTREIGFIFPKFVEEEEVETTLT